MSTGAGLINRSRAHAPRGASAPLKAHGVRPPYLDFSEQPGSRSRAVLGYRLMGIQVGKTSNSFGLSNMHE